MNFLAGAALSAVLVLAARFLPPGLDTTGYLLLIAAGLATGSAWRWPRLATAVVTVVLASFELRNYPADPVWACGWLTLLALSASPRSARRTAILGAAGMILTLSVCALLLPYAHVAALLPLIFLGWSVAAVAAGLALRNLSRSREEESRRRIVEERLRIARDLHDSVAHGLATINVQAAAAGHVLAKRPEAAASALSIIEQTSATVLDELATMLTVLREPGPGLESLDRLAANARAAGLTVSLTVTGPIRAIPHGPATAAYRIVQESLTNVIRHASATAAHVTVRAGPDHALHLEIRDNGPRGAPSTQGPLTGDHPEPATAPGKHKRGQAPTDPGSRAHTAGETVLGSRAHTVTETVLGSRAYTVTETVLGSRAHTAAETVRSPHERADPEAGPTLCKRTPATADQGSREPPRPETGSAWRERAGPQTSSSLREPAGPETGSTLRKCVEADTGPRVRVRPDAETGPALRERADAGADPGAREPADARIGPALRERVEAETGSASPQRADAGAGPGGREFADAETRSAFGERVEARTDLDARERAEAGTGSSTREHAEAETGSALCQRAAGAASPGTRDRADADICSGIRERAEAGTGLDAPEHAEAGTGSGMHECEEVRAGLGMRERTEEEPGRGVREPVEKEAGPGTGERAEAAARSDMRGRTKAGSGANMGRRAAAASDANMGERAAATGPDVGERAEAGTGLGIRGMRERAEATGGVLAAGPLREGGFVVSAHWEGRR